MSAKRLSHSRLNNSYIAAAVGSIATVEQQMGATRYLLFNTGGDTPAFTEI